ncbi:MAG TPA: ComEA family DNA-binding protein [Candidatus Ozemobacteraceae bacterium]|nr:ComEA family DNA-binding protein [Candidatus Ozemobacteraceae bacterium]
MKHLTTLEKTTFSLMGGMIVLGMVLLLFQLARERTSNLSCAGQIDRIAALTDRSVPAKAEAHEEADESSSPGSLPRMNVNTATLAQLDALPGIGKVMAERIIELRKQKGGLKTLSELKEIKGVSPKKYSELCKVLAAAGESAGEQRKLNLNFATLDELEALPGVGPKLARAIFDARNNKGGFKSVKDLEDIPGLSEKKYKLFEPFVEIK